MTFGLALLVVAAGGVAGVLAARFLAKRLASPIPPFDVPDSWGDDPDDKRWGTEALDITHGSLKAVQASATSWAATITALLGIGGTVAVVKGPDTFAKLSTGTGNVVFWLSAASGLLAAAAIVFASLAAQGTPHRVQGLDGYALKRITADGARLAADRLLWSRTFTVVAAASVLLAVGISWKAGIATGTPSSTSALAVTSDGVVRCGTLQAGSDGAVMMTAGTAHYALRDGAPITTVDSCPAAP